MWAGFSEDWLSLLHSHHRLQSFSTPHPPIILLKKVVDIFPLMTTPIYKFNTSDILYVYMSVLYG